MKQPFRQLLMILILALAATAFAGAAIFQMPLYTGEQLRNPDFVRSEIARLGDLRAEAALRYRTVSPLHRSMVGAQMNKMDLVLRTLNHIDTHGFNPAEVVFLNCPCITPEVTQYRGFEMVDIRAPQEPAVVAEKVYDVNEAGMTPPKPVRTPQFEIPPEVIGTGISGKMNVLITIGKDGRPSDVMARNEITPALTETVSAQIKERWMFKPALLHGKPVPVRMPWVFTFSYTVIQPTSAE